MQIPALHDFWSQDTNKTPELHVSLSRPIFLRAYQRDELKRTVKALASTSSPSVLAIMLQIDLTDPPISFTVSFASFGALTNDEHTRAFLAVEIGAGHDNVGPSGIRIYYTNRLC